MRDQMANLGNSLALASAVQSAATQGPAIDLLGFESVTFLVATGAIASSGDFGVKLQESDTSVAEDFTDVAAAQVKGNAPATLEASSAYKLGYTGFRRYVRLALTKAGGTSIAAGAVAVKGHAHARPVA
jgi:hypothetical protein